MKSLNWLRVSLLLVACFIGPMAYAASSLPTPAQIETVSRSDEPVSASLLSEAGAVQPGQPFWVGIKLTMSDGWDTYWINPGDVGLPTQVSWDLPKGFQVEDLVWPAPKRFETDAMVGFGYTDNVLLMAKVTPSKSLKAGDEVKLGAHVRWLACKDSCMPGEATVHITLPVSEEAVQADSQTKALFAATRHQVPKEASAAGQFSIKEATDEVVLFFKPLVNDFVDRFESIQFFPEQQNVFDLSSEPAVHIDSGGITLNLKKHMDQLPSDLKGILVIQEKGSAQPQVLQIDQGLLGMSTAPLSKVTLGFLWIILSAFLGGLILNVMPCVLPVIALKIFSFVKMGQEKRGVIFKHGLIFTAGVLVSFWILSAALLLLRAYGQSVGWGFQLQEPAFVAVMIAIIFLLGLSLLGVFELGTSMISVGQNATSSKGSPYVSSFMSGVLATLVATPCTGPLLGPALGFALTLPTMSALVIFTFMGLGMASPYLLFAAFPALVRYLPKPGNWMILFKKIMGFLMMATALWLIWVFMAQTSPLALFILLASLFGFSIAAWIYGEWATPMRKKRTRRIATVIALSLMAVSSFQMIKAARLPADSSQEQLAQDGAWQAYNPQKIAELQSEGHPVFVDFTAKWCLTCQANKVILHSSEVMRAFEEQGVVTMTADWTKRDQVITKELEALGRSSVPVYVLYPAKANEKPVILPQTLTQSVVQDYLNRLNVD